MTEAETRTVLYRFGEVDGPNVDQVVDHPGQPADYVHTDGTHLRVYDLVTPSTDSR